MLNLRKAIIEDYWENQSPRLSKVIKAMERVEFWTVDESQEVTGMLDKLSTRLDKSQSDSISENSNKLLFVMAYMSSGRSIRMMKWFDEKFANDLSADIVSSAKENEEDPVNRLLLDRLQTIKSLTLMQSIFSPARTKKILKILEEME